MKRLSLLVLLGGFAVKGLAPAEAVATSPTLTASNVSVTEGNSGTRMATITVTLSVAPTSPLTISYSTADGSAEAGSDYVPTRNSATIAANAKTFSFDVPIIGDSQVERDEVFKVNFSAPGYKSHRPGALVTIINDDNAPTNSYSRDVPRGRGSRPVQPTVTATAPPQTTVTATPPPNTTVTPTAPPPKTTVTPTAPPPNTTVSPTAPPKIKVKPTAPPKRR